MAVADLAHAAQVGHRDRLTAARVVGHGHEDGWHVRGAALADEAIQRVEVHVALEGMDGRRLTALRDDQVDSLGAGEFDIRPRRVEVRVAGDRLARSADDAEEDLLRRPALVRRDDMAEREQVLDRVQEPEPRWRAGIALVAALDARPLVAAHGARAGIGEQVDEHIVGVDVEQVVARRLERRGALLDRRQPDRFDRVDAKRLDDRLPAVHAGQDTAPCWA